MFTGLLPREHGAHFGTMAYSRPEPTIAEVLRENGYSTEAVTRNFVFDGNIPGLLRGFERVTRPRSSGSSAAAMLLAAAKPRIQRHFRETGFFHPQHRESIEFVRAFAKSLLPADDLLLDGLIESMKAHRKNGRPFFLFANLYDVHAPYPPQTDSILRPWDTWGGCLENLLLPPALAQLGAHRYLRPGFSMPALLRDRLRGRYATATELMDRKLEGFFREASSHGLLDDTLIVLTSDHGEAFGEHGLYLHDASVFETHLHVPLWIHTPRGDRGLVNDVVSTRDLFGLMRAFAIGGTLRNTVMDESYRERRPFAEADHFHYPHLQDAAPRYQVDQRAVITASRKFVVRGDSGSTYDLRRDGEEEHPETMSLRALGDAMAAAGLDKSPTNALIGAQR